MRIHAYNILRVLFRDSSLGEVVSPFISDGLRAAIGGFKASQWPVSILLDINMILFFFKRCFHKS